MVMGGEKYAAAIRSLWSGRCTVTVWSNDMVNEATGRVEPREQTLCADEPCRISFQSVTDVEPMDGANKVAQTVTLFIAPDAPVPPGSRITVTQNGVTAAYKQSGEPAVYSTHKEIPLELFGGWA